MAQTEDTELRDLVIEALERNGSLAKIRALLRANIFLAFEDDYENRKQNINLDNVLKCPEGILALSVIHEFLDFCCLKNTLFVYMSESRQGNEYSYEGKKSLADKLLKSKNEASKEPILLSLIKSFSISHQKKMNDLKTYDKNSREDQNCTYILHDSQSSTTSTSNSDNSSDEKNKLHLQLQLDHSDTDTSSDSLRDKSRSEYIPGDHILKLNNSNLNKCNPDKPTNQTGIKNQSFLMPQNKSAQEVSSLTNDLKITNSSSDSTSYLELKPFNSSDEKLLNTAGLPTTEVDYKNTVSKQIPKVTNTSNNVKSLGGLLPLSLNKASEHIEGSEKKSKGRVKSDGESSDFSYRDDFSSSPVKEVSDKDQNKPEYNQDDVDNISYKNSAAESQHQTSQCSQSSVSISDVTDLISEKSSINSKHKSIQSLSNHSKEKTNIKPSKSYSDDSGDFTESPVPSLSNLSLDIHSN